MPFLVPPSDEDEDNSLFIPPTTPTLHNRLVDRNPNEPRGRSVDDICHPDPDRSHVLGVPISPPNRRSRRLLSSPQLSLPSTRGPPTSTPGCSLRAPIDPSTARGRGRGVSVRSQISIIGTSIPPPPIITDHRGNPLFIPGPAGSAFGNIHHPDTPNVFASDVWHRFLKEHDIKPYGEQVLQFSISQLQSNAVNKKYEKIDFAARVKSVAFSYRCQSFELEDESGTIKATCSDVIVSDDDRLNVGVGDIIVLSDVFAVYYVPEHNKGFRIDIPKYIHLSFGKENVASIFSIADKQEFPVKEITESVYSKNSRVPSHEVEKDGASVIRERANREIGTKEGY